METSKSACIQFVETCSVHFAPRICRRAMAKRLTDCVRYIKRIKLINSLKETVHFVFSIRLNYELNKKNLRRIKSLYPISRTFLCWICIVRKIIIIISVLENRPNIKKWQKNRRKVLEPAGKEIVVPLRRHLHRYGETNANQTYIFGFRVRYFTAFAVVVVSSVENEKIHWHFAYGIPNTK